ncbi:unnamed protein product [Leptidea sinapis]|uniref:Uncharacterized protein n=1 Tax=Leptidea sinapis TaxID=189913 RepID=A0A5E4QCI7_9NEOP|nr:unnamed protein product [Leptidea sinapis]
MSSPPPAQEEVEVGDESMEEDSPEMIPADRFTLPACADAVVEQWRTKMDEGVLSQAHFQDHWRERANTLLFQPLERFVWGDTDLSTPAPPRRATLCGKVYQRTDTTSTRWANPVAAAAAPDEKGEAHPHISPQVLERLRIVASVCLSYCFRLLTLDHAPGLPNDLRLKDAECDLLQILDQPDCYCTVLYNDETHTFEQPPRLCGAGEPHRPRGSHDRQVQFVPALRQAQDGHRDVHVAARPRAPGAGDARAGCKTL